MAQQRSNYDPLELIAELLHIGWLKWKLDNGFRYGEKREGKTHPHIIAWPQKDAVDLNQDRFQAAWLLESWSRGDVNEGNLAEKIHEAWVQWIYVSGRSHSHALPYQFAHEEKGAKEHAVQAEEHAVQAELILNILKVVPVHPEHKNRDD